MEHSFESAVLRVREFISSSSHQIELVNISETTATAVQAADALKVEVDQIGKSIAVGTKEDLYIVLLRGTSRVSLDKIREITEKPVKLLDKDQVYQRTGFKVGGVSPIGSIEMATVIMDQGLYNFQEIWVAGGSPFSVFGCSPEILQALTNAKVCDVTV